MIDWEDERPPRLKPRIKSAPRIRSVYWCDFPKDAQLPEFWKGRPVLVVSKQSTLHGTVTVLPFSSKSQPDNPKAVSMKSPIDGRLSWVICNYPTTVAVSRLSAPRREIPRVDQKSFNRIIGLMLEGLPRSEY